MSDEKGKSMSCGPLQLEQRWWRREAIVIEAYVAARMDDRVIIVLCEKLGSTCTPHSGHALGCLICILAAEMGG